MSKKLTFTSLAILIIASMDNMKNMPTSAFAGSSLLFFFAISALLFLIPTALVSAQLSAAFPDKGGVYHWVSRAFGQRAGLAAVWLQWINTMVWYPTMLSFIAATCAYLIDPELSENKIYLISCILLIFWGLTWINLKGIHASSKFTNVCAIIGTMIPMTILIVMGFIWALSGKPLQISFQIPDMVPSFTQFESWSFLVAIMASFLGVELSSVHIHDIHEPQKNFPKAILIGGLFAFLSMSLCSLSIASVIAQKEINLVAGVMQVFCKFFEAFSIPFFSFWLALSIVIGSVGTMINWLIAPAKGLLHAAESGFFPPFFARKNQTDTPSNILFIQAILVSLLSLAFLFLPSINGCFWFFTALSTELYMIMYILMFASVLKLHHFQEKKPLLFKIPGKSFGIWSVCSLGFLGCILTIAVSFYPPENIDTGSFLGYLITIGIGNFITISPIFFFYVYKERKNKKIQVT